MRIEETTRSFNSNQPLQEESPSWNEFFNHFSDAPSLEEKKQIREHLLHQLSFEINRHMKRMIESIKKMRDENRRGEA